MGNKKKSNFFVRFLGNKNTVTILGILACVATLVIGYNIRLNSSIDPETVPYAKVNIPARTLIKSDMIGRLKVSKSYLSTANNVIKNEKEVVNMFATYKSSIPEGSLFYKELVKTADQMPDAAWSNIANGYTIFSLDVTNDATYGGQVYAGEFIDLYMSATNPDTNKIIFAELIKSIRVLAVKDQSGNNILQGEKGKPSELQFAVPEDMFLLLSRATNLKSAKIKIIPVLRNHNYTVQAEEAKVSYKQLVEFIMERVEEF